MADKVSGSKKGDERWILRSQKDTREDLGKQKTNADAEDPKTEDPNNVKIAIIKN